MPRMTQAEYDRRGRAIEAEVRKRYDRGDADHAVESWQSLQWDVLDGAFMADDEQETERGRASLDLHRAGLIDEDDQRAAM